MTQLGLDANSIGLSRKIYLKKISRNFTSPNLVSLLNGRFRPLTLMLEFLKENIPLFNVMKIEVNDIVVQRYKQQCAKIHRRIKFLYSMKDD